MPPKRKPAPKLDVAIAAQVERVRAANAKAARDEQRDVTWYERCGELARDNEVAPGEVFEEFDERAGVNEFAGGHPRAKAEELAFDAVRQRFTKQAALAV